MAALRCARVLLHTNTLSARTLNISQRTLCTLRVRDGVSCVWPWGVGVGVRACSSKPPQHSLAEELLAAKVQAGSPEQQQQQQQRTDEDNSSDKKTQEERDKTYRTLKYSFAAFGVMMSSMGGFLIWSWGAPNVDESRNAIRDEFSDMMIVKQYLYRTWKGVHDVNKMIQEPSREKLLPDPLKEPYVQPPYTLVMELRDVLVHPEWTYETGWRFKKRPGVEFLLHHCAPPLFEIVIYTNEQGFTAYPLIDHLDPNNYIWYRLFKDSTRYVEGKHIKDLNCLNRDLNKVIFVDWDSDAVSNSRNHLKIKRWDGSMDDKSLLDLGFMLRTIAESEVSDVREVIDYYRTFDDPLLAFRENQRKAQEQEIALSQKAEEERQQRTFTSSWTSSFLRRR